MSPRWSLSRRSFPWAHCSATAMLVKSHSLILKGNHSFLLHTRLGVGDLARHLNLEDHKKGLSEGQVTMNKPGLFS